MNQTVHNTRTSYRVARERSWRASTAGFTLVELMIVIAIIGVLAAVALPAYQNNVRSGARAEAQSLLLQVASSQERFYSDNNSYSANADPLASPVVETLTTESGRYQVAVAACDTGSISNCFVATATPQGDQTADSCTTLTLASTGLKGATGDTVDNCWR